MSRICFIAPHVYPFYKGGAEVQIHHLIVELLKRGWKVSYICEMNAGSGVNLPGVDLFFLPKRKKNLKFLNYFALKKALCRISPNVIYVRPVVQYVALAQAVGRKIGARTIWACSSDLQLETSYHIKRWSLLTYLNYFLFRRSIGQIHATIVQTSWQLEVLKSQFGIQGALIHNGHPIKPISHSLMRPTRVVWIGRAHAVKNPLAFVSLAKLFSKSDVIFSMVVSDGDNDVLSLIIEQSSGLVHFELLQKLESNDVASLLSQSKVLVNTSHREGFSNTFIEAWMNGVPVLALNADPEGLLSSAQAGALCSDLESLRDSILELISNQSKWNDLSNSVRSLVLQRFNVELATEKLIKVATI